LSFSYHAFQQNLVVGLKCIQYFIAEQLCNISCRICTDCWNSNI